MEHTITINDIPPSLNIMGNYHWAVRSKKKKEFEEMVFWALKASKCPYFDRAKLRITYYFKDKRKRDYDNYSGKWLIDGLKGRAIKDDNQDYIRGVEIVFDYDKEHPRTELRMKSV